MNFDQIDLRWENMMAGIKGQVPYLRDAPSAIYTEIKASIQLDRPPSRVYLTGCGDSWYCAMATRFAFEEWTGIPTEAIEALEFSRYMVKYAPQDSLVVSVSNSGRVARTIEAALQARQHGMYAVGFTSNLKEGLSQAVDAAFDLGYAERRFAPGTNSYMASMLTEYCLALYLAELNGRMSSEQVQAKLAEMSSLSEGMEKTIRENEALLEDLGTRANLSDLFVFIGGGPNYGTAFSAWAKVIETARVSRSVGQQLEEWAHTQFFVTGRDTHTFVLAAPGASTDRAREQMYAVKQTGSTCIAICDPLDKETQAQADVVIPVFGEPDELLSPLLYCVPGQLFAFFLAATRDLKMFGFDDEHIKQLNWRQIFGSRILGRDS